MELNIAKPGSGAAGTVSVSDTTFAREYNEDLIHQVVTAYMAGGRQGSRAQKTRAEVRGGGKKPWRQKGSGRARAGSSRSPIWRSGGVTFAARPQDHSKKVNRKMYRAAIASILSELNRQGRITVVEAFDVDGPKTKGLVGKLAALNVGKRPLIVTEEATDNLYLSARNLPYVQVRDVQGLDPVSLVGADTVVVTTDAVKKIEEWLA